MIVETVQRYATWLQDAELGVNALLPTVPLPSGATVPPAVTVYDETRTGWVARGTLDRGILAGVRALTINLAAEVVPFAANGEDSAGPQLIPLLIRYAAVGALSEELVRDAWLTLRCVQRALAGRFDGDVTAETHGGVTHFPPAGFRHVPDINPQGDGLYVGGLVALARTSDPWALGIDLVA